MDLVMLAQKMGSAMPILAALLILSTAYWFVLAMPRGRRTHRYSVFIAADPRTVWDTYFYHIGHRDYRPCHRFLSCEVLAENPLTIRYTIQQDIHVKPVSVISCYEIFEPYARYRETALGVIAEGEFRQVAGGTRLEIRVTAPTKGWLLPWALRRRQDANHRALKDVCEGRVPEAPRGALPARQWEVVAIWAGVGVLLVAFVNAPSQGASSWVPLLLLLGVAGLVVRRWSRFFSRFLALG